MEVPCGSASLLGLFAELVRDFKQLKGQEEEDGLWSRRRSVRVGQPRPTEGGGLGA